MRPSIKRDVGYAALALASVVCVSISGQIATYPNLKNWYADLIKPSFNPPDWVFAPVWVTLYALMAFAVWRILRLPARTEGKGQALAAFYAQLGLNALWSWMFFGLNSTALGLVNIIPQLAMILLTIVLFHRLDGVAAWCLSPLVVWVGYATLLNGSLWWLNG